MMNAITTFKRDPRSVPFTCSPFSVLTEAQLGRRNEFNVQNTAHLPLLDSEINQPRNRPVRTSDYYVVTLEAAL